MPCVRILLLALALVVTGCRPADVPPEPDPEEAAPEPAPPPDPERPHDGPPAFPDVGVTEEPCPGSPHQDRGCIYLGILSDLSEGPFAPLGAVYTEAQTAFWGRVNDDGGIAGRYDVDVTTYTRDTRYDPQRHAEAYVDLAGETLMLAQTLGAPTTAQILDDMVSDGVLAAPTSWTSAWAFVRPVLESGTNHCLEAMNAVDYAVEQHGVARVLAVHYPGDYGADGAAGARFAAEAHGLDFTTFEQAPLTEDATTTEAVNAILEYDPDLVHVTTSPRELAEIAGAAAAQGFTGRFIGTGPTWDAALLRSPAGPALHALYEQSAPWAGWAGDAPGHHALREALGEVEPHDGYVSGWAWQYPIRALLELAAERGDVSRSGLHAVMDELVEVDYEGILPPVQYARAPDQAVVRHTVISRVEPEAPTGLALVRDLFVGPTAEQHEFTRPCFQQ